jgi:adenylate cyclase
VEPAEAVLVLNRLFDVVVPILHEHGGHANHYLGDGLLAVFGAPNPMEDHADAAVGAAVDLQQRVRQEFGTTLRLGVGINTGPVIAGTVGGGGRHEFTVIGDTVNLAARVEQLTKDTGDAILITEATRAALSTPRPRSIKRGDFDVRGKAAKVCLYAVNPFPRPNARLTEPRA